MEASNAAALRVVLGVTEISEVHTLRLQLDELRNKSFHRMRAYHFRETLRRFSKLALDEMNENAGQVLPPLY